jgi:class 3 adenylate cyclase/tetratricopeptide (TPR) repeat protein
MQCPKCDTENPEQARFCLNCGARLALACPQCGTELPPQARFCFACGTPQVSEPTPDALREPGSAALSRALERLLPKGYAERLLAERGKVGKERRMVTILFSDVKGSTQMAGSLDPEEWMEIMEGAFDVLIEPIYRYEGTLARLMGDAILAFFGAPIAHEDDPERAIRAALEIIEGARRYAARLEEERGIRGFNVRVGINTGLVVVGEVGSDLRVEYTAMGDAVNLAARMEQAAPVGGILISHDTYRHVRGVFDVRPQEPLTVKGKAEPVQTYIVERAKPRPFRMARRGVEGIDTRMVGRDAELLMLQNTLHDAMEDAETRVVTVVSEAGVGKSRLLYEFDNWIELLPDQIWYFKGRATPEMQTIPYGIIRDMFAYRFDIRESDSAATVLEKFRAGMAGILDPDRADLGGHFIGFDFSASQVVQNLLGSESFAKLARAYLTNYVRAVASQPTVIFLEDVHWADGSSLDLLDHLVREIPGARLLVVCLTRTPLFERRPNWGDPSTSLRAGGREAHTRLDLKPLSRRACRALVGEILQKVDHLPDDLRDLVVDSAEGNPFYVEELVKMLVEDGVIQRGEKRWRVELDRLADVRVPPTLTGVLQARLDSLPREEKEALQRASVVGRLFWDAAVAELAADDADRLDKNEIAPLLDAVRGRELVFRRERSAFEGAEEYIFKHAVLRDVTYETVLLKLRRVYHAQVAKWLETNAGERLGEYLSLIAGHYELAGEQAKAADYLQRSGEELYRISAFRDAIGAFERALTMLPEGEAANRAALLVKLGMAYEEVGDYPAATQHLEQGLALAREAGDPQTEVAALNWLAQVASNQGKYDEAEHYLKMGLALAREHDDQAGTALALENLGRIAFFRGESQIAESYIAQSSAIYRELGDQQGGAEALRCFGMCAILQGKYEEGKQYTEESLTLNREIGDRHKVALCLVGLGEIARRQGKYEEAKQYYEEGLLILREIGARDAAAMCLNNLGHVHAALGEEDVAWTYLREAISESLAMGTATTILEALVGVAGLQAKARRSPRAAELLDHPALDEFTKQYADPLLATLREALPADQLEAALERGKSLDLEGVVAEVLAGSE